MAHLKGNQQFSISEDFILKYLMQCKVTANFVNRDGQNFYEIFKIFEVINQKQ